MLQPEQIQSDKDIIDFFIHAIKGSSAHSRQPREVEVFAKANKLVNLVSTKRPNTVMQMYVEELMTRFANSGESQIFSVPYIGRFIITEQVNFTGNERTVYTKSGSKKVIDDHIDFLPTYKVTFRPTFRVIDSRALFNKYVNTRKLRKLMLPLISALEKPVHSYPSTYQKK